MAQWLWAMVGVIGGWLGATAIEYAKAKGRNLADKEDIREITGLVEAVKHENSVLLEQLKGIGQLRLAAAERRLQAHQDAFTLWRKLILHTHQEDAKVVVHECQEWWEKNCLFLASEASEAFAEAFFAAGEHRTLLESARYQSDRREGSKLLRRNWETVMAAGPRIVAAVALPPLGHAAAGAPDAEGKKEPVTAPA